MIVKSLLHLLRPFRAPRVPAASHPSMWLGADPARVSALRLATSVPIVDVPERHERGWSSERLARRA